MKKYVLPVLAIAGLLSAGGWLWLRPDRPVPVAKVTMATPPANKPIPSPSPPPPPLSVAVPVPASAPKAATVVRPSRPDAPIKIDLNLALDPDNRYHDDLVGVSANVPEGWKVRDAQRWGEGHRENTMWMQPAGSTSAVPSMYYRAYRDNEAADRYGDVETLMRSMAQKKEESRSGGGFGDYKNVPESFAFTEINGNPSLSYFATYTQGNDVRTEYFIRILGPTGYVMFFTSGKLEDVKAAMPQLQKMAGSVKVR